MLLDVQEVAEDKKNNGAKTQGQKPAGSILQSLRAIPLGTVLALTLAWVFDMTLSFRPLVPADSIFRFDNMALGLLCLICALFPGRARRFIDARCSGAVACLSGLIGACIALVLALDGTDGTALSMVVLSAIALVSMTFFQGYIFIFAFCKIAYLGMMKSLVAFTVWLASVGLLMFALSFAYNLLYPAACAYIISILVNIAIPVVVYLLIRRKGPVGQTRAARSGADRNIPYNLLVVQFVILVVIKALSVFMAPSIAPDFKSVAACGFLVAGVGILVFLRLRKKLIDLKWFYNIALFLVELSILLLSLKTPDASYASSALMGCAYTVLAVFCFTIYANVCLRYRIDPVRLSALAFGCESVASALGVLSSPILLKDDATQATALVALSMVIAVVFLFLFSDADYRTGWSSEKSKKSTEKIVEYYYSMPSVCSALARQYDLSAREEDILLLLLQKKSGPVIAQELYISPSTVKSHTRNIYKKLDIHSREELLALIESPL